MTGAGKRNQRVLFQRKGLDENDDPQGPWEDGFSRWARVQVLRVGEGVIQQRQQGVATVKITVLADGQTRSVTSAWRAMWKDQAFNLSAPAPDEVNAEIAFDGVADQSEAG
jgi:head-tail adaptor